MKGTVITIMLESNSTSYVSQKIGPTLRVPAFPSQIPMFFETVVTVIILVQAYAEANARILTDKFSKDISDFGSQSPKNNNQTILKDLWLGPKPFTPSVVPSIPKDTFSDYHT
jgi:hypothetical protein